MTTQAESTDSIDDADDRWVGRRSDARRNHERVLAAAIEVFTEEGLEATIPQVAARAGVGKATVYRSYPTKADLVSALAQTHLDWLRGNLEHAARQADVDAYGALDTFLQEVAGRLAEDKLMVEVLGQVTPGLVGEAEKSQVAHLLARGREQGSLRADATATDIQVLVSGFARSLIALGIRDPDTWRRYARLTLAALRA